LISILVGDCRETLATLDARSVQTCVTSPPYFGLRDYGTGEWEGGDLACDHVAKPAILGAAETTRPTAGPTRGGAQAAQRLDIQFAGKCGKCGATRVDRQIGLEPTPDEFVTALVEVFREVRRVLRDDGTVWLNLGDSYNSAASNQNAVNARRDGTSDAKQRALEEVKGRQQLPVPSIKAKDLLGIPWMVAFALRTDGWYLRSDIIWAKPNPMPESVTDRPTKAHEYLFLLSKSPRYFYDADAIKEEMAEASAARYEYGFGGPKAEALTAAERDGAGTRTHPIGEREAGAGRNKRSVWTVATQPYPGAHFATFPPKLIEPCILAGSSPKACGACGAPWQRMVEHEKGDEEASGRPRTIGWESSCEHDDDSGSSVVLDPFAGSGTTGAVATEHGRSFIGCELNPEYAKLIEARLLAAPIALEGFGAA
jgi:DNA modification methylase